MSGQLGGQRQVLIIMTGSTILAYSLSVHACLEILPSLQAPTVQLSQLMRSAICVAFMLAALVLSNHRNRKDTDF